MSFVDSLKRFCRIIVGKEKIMPNAHLSPVVPKNDSSILLGSKFEDFTYLLSDEDSGNEIITPDLPINTDSDDTPIRESADPDILITANSEKMSFHDKEALTVQKTQLSDLQKLSGFPYIWDLPLFKHIQPHSHPYVSMDISDINKKSVFDELSIINRYLRESRLLCDKVPEKAQIPLDNLIFTPSEEYGHSRFFCSPITYDGKPSKSPITLFFTTDPRSGVSTHGELIYNQFGRIEKAHIFFWWGMNGLFFHYETVEDSLVLARLTSPSYGGNEKTYYKGPHIIAWEERLIQEKMDFDWIQENIPDKCPKSITGYRRMKTMNSKNYQVLKNLAAQKGRNIL